MQMIARVGLASLVFASQTFGAALLLEDGRKLTLVGYGSRYYDVADSANSPPHTNLHCNTHNGQVVRCDELPPDYPGGATMYETARWDFTTNPVPAYSSFNAEVRGEVIVGVGIVAQESEITADYFSARGAASFSGGVTENDARRNNTGTTDSTSLYHVRFSLEMPHLFQLDGKFEGLSNYGSQSRDLGGCYPDDDYCTTNIFASLRDDSGNVIFYFSAQTPQVQHTGYLRPGIYELVASASAGGIANRYEQWHRVARFDIGLRLVPTDLVVPTIMMEPRPRTNVVGSSLMLSATVGGTEPLSYQWFKDNETLPGATGRTHVLTNVRSTDAGAYHVTVSNAVGIATSSNAVLTIAPAEMPSVIAGPLINPANGHEYFLLAQSTWIEAEAAAQALGGHLATLRSASEQEWLFTNFSTWGGQERSLWIGLHDTNALTNATNQVDRRTEFVWSSGEPVTYANWNASEPNNYRELGEYYVHTEPIDLGSWNDTWDTDFNQKPLHGVVEVIPVKDRPEMTIRVAEVEVCWTSRADRMYLVQYRSELTTNMWTDLMAAIQGTGTNNCIIDPIPRGEPQRYYRVQTVP